MNTGSLELGHKLFAHVWVCVFECAILYKWTSTSLDLHIDVALLVKVDFFCLL